MQILLSHEAMRGFVNGSAGRSRDSNNMVDIVVGLGPNFILATIFILHI